MRAPVRPRSVPTAPAGPGYPDASNMPSLSGATLTYYPNFPASLTPSTVTLSTSTPPGLEFDSTSSGQIIENLDIQGSVVIKHPGVTVRRCRIWGWDFYGFLADAGAFSGAAATIEDCIIESPRTTSGSTGLASTNFLAQRCNVNGVENGFDVLTDFTVKDCYVHDLYNGGAAHADCIQTSSGAGSNIANGLVQHCTLLSRDSGGLDGTSCIINAVGSTSFTDLTYTDNVMAGGAFCFYGPQSTTGTRVAITNNKFAQFWNATAGAFGPWTDATDEATVSGNQLGNFAGGISGAGGGVISGAWSGTPIP